MIRRRLYRGLADRIPPRLRELRAKLMLEGVCENFGVEETTCPACGGSGWLDPGAFEHCPVCCGFREVPTQLAYWLRDELASARQRPQPRYVGPVVPSDAAGSAPRERLGRLAELTYKTHLSATRAD